MVRWPARPRAVVVDAQAVFVLPRTWAPPNKRPLGVSAGGLDLQLQQEVIPATLHRWFKSNFGIWFAELEITYVSSNGALEMTLRQWVHQHAIRLPSSPHSPATARIRH
ncbi:hypothetical protein ACFXHA_43280 [Nocardia sp. NPDC059240]|uniref:hypothetical protein n=1 Tax=Nocardia sp. NPDC059240 TaxID=3346786 RepID=UPI0036BF6312